MAETTFGVYTGNSTTSGPPNWRMSVQQTSWPVVFDHQSDHQHRHTLDPVPQYQHTHGAERYQQQEQKPNMRGLFEVFIVDPETASLVAHEHVVANDERTAQLKGAMDAKLGDVDDYDFIVRRLGDVRPKKKAKAS